MVNTQYLEELISKSGVKKSAICEKLGISYETLKRKVTNKNDFYTNEVTTLCDILGVKSLKEKERIFFCRRVDKKETVNV